MHPLLSGLCPAGQGWAPEGGLTTQGLRGSLRDQRMVTSDLSSPGALPWFLRDALLGACNSSLGPRGHACDCRIRPLCCVPSGLSGSRGLAVPHTHRQQAAPSWAVLPPLPGSFGRGLGLLPVDS